MMAKSFAACVMFILLALAPCNGQRDIAKFDPLQVFFGNFTFNHEHLSSKQDRSLGAAFVFTVPKKLPYHRLFNMDNNTREDLKNLRYYGMGIFPEYRFYLINNGNYPTGYYLSPYLGTSYNILYGSYKEPFEIPGESVVYIEGRFVEFRTGISFGYQKIWKDNYTLDFTFISIGATAINGQIILQSDAFNVGVEQYTEEKFHDYINRIGTIEAKEMEPTRARARIRGLVPYIMSGIKLGYYF